MLQKLWWKYLYLKRKVRYGYNVAQEATDLLSVVIDSFEDGTLTDEEKQLITDEAKELIEAWKEFREV